jgi:hypothetical protein
MFWQSNRGDPVRVVRWVSTADEWAFSQLVLKGLYASRLGQVDEISSIVLFNLPIKCHILFLSV